MASRSKRLYIRISNQEYGDIYRNAKIANLNMSQYARKILTGEIVTAAKPPEYRQLYNEVNKIGVNVNQIAKVANSSGLVDAATIRQMQYLLTKIYNRIDEALM